MLKKITARHFDLTPNIKEKAEEEMERLTRFFDNIVSAELILDQEKHRRIAELKVNVYNQTISGSGDSDNLYNSIEVAVDKAIGQLKKYKGKLKNRRPEEITEKKESLTRPSTNADELDV
jgi:ribosome hibernation promoting factor